MLVPPARATMRALLATLLLLASLAPTAGAALPPGCTFASTAYVCTLNETGDCTSVTALGAGVGGTAGVATSDSTTCDSRTRIVTASAGTMFVNAAIVENGGGCEWQVVSPAGFFSSPCPDDTPDLALPSVAPPSVEGCTGPVCVFEWNSVYEPCSEGGFESHTTSVSVGDAVTAQGYSYCYGPASGDRAVHVITPAGTIMWGEVYYSDPENGEFHSCFVQAFGVVSQDTGDVCAPNPGWGNVLP